MEDLMHGLFGTPYFLLARRAFVIYLLPFMGIVFYQQRDLHANTSVSIKIQ